MLLCELNEKLALEGMLTPPDFKPKYECLKVPSKERKFNLELQMTA